MAGSADENNKAKARDAARDAMTTEFERSLYAAVDAVLASPEWDMAEYDGILGKPHVDKWLNLEFGEIRKRLLYPCPKCRETHSPDDVKRWMTEYRDRMQALSAIASGAPLAESPSQEVTVNELVLARPDKRTRLFPWHESDIKRLVEIEDRSRTSKSHFRQGAEATHTKNAERVKGIKTEILKFRDMAKCSDAERQDRDIAAELLSDQDRRTSIFGAVSDKTVKKYLRETLGLPQHVPIRMRKPKA